jgi:hypothetical protein
MAVILQWLWRTKPLPYYLPDAFSPPTLVKAALQRCMIATFAVIFILIPVQVYSLVTDYNFDT